MNRNEHESAPEQAQPEVDDAMSDASGDTAKTPSEDDPTAESTTAELPEEPE